MKGKCFNKTCVKNYIRKSRSKIIFKIDLHVPKLLQKSRVLYYFLRHNTQALINIVYNAVQKGTDHPF